MARRITSPIRAFAVAPPDSAPQPQFKKPQYTEDEDRRLRLVSVPTPLNASLRWEKRPKNPGGNPSWTYWIDSPNRKFGAVVGHIQNGSAYPFEVFAIGDAPRGLDSIAKSLSLDMRSRDRGWLKRKLEALVSTEGDSFDMIMPNGVLTTVPSEVSAWARLVLFRCEELGGFANITETPILDALMSRREPKTTAHGAPEWGWDIYNPSTGDKVHLTLKEADLPDQTRRPISMWLSRKYPRSLDGLCKVLSLDMRVVEIEWSLNKLRQLRDVEEVNGGFMAPIPGSEKSQFYGSTVAYIAALVLHRYHVLGLADEAGRPLTATGGLIVPPLQAVNDDHVHAARGGKCDACGAHAVRSEAGCKTCGECGSSRCN